MSFCFDLIKNHHVIWGVNLTYSTPGNNEIASYVENNCNLEDIELVYHLQIADLLELQNIASNYKYWNSMSKLEINLESKYTCRIY